MKIEMKILTAIHKCKQPRFVLMAIITSGVLLTTPPVWARKVQFMVPFDASMLTRENNSVRVRCRLLVDYKGLPSNDPSMGSFGRIGQPDPKMVLAATSRDYPVNARGNASGMARVDINFSDPLESTLKMYMCDLLAKRNDGSVCEVSNSVPSQLKSRPGLFSQFRPAAPALEQCERAPGTSAGSASSVVRIR